MSYGVKYDSDIRTSVCTVRTVVVPKPQHHCSGRRRVVSGLLWFITVWLKQTRVGSPEATASLLRSPQGSEWIIAAANKKPVWGCMGRALNLIDPIGSSSVSSASVAQIELRIFGIHSSSFPPDLLVASPVCSRVCNQVDNVLVFRPAVIFIPGNLAAWDESAWNRSRDESMDATRWIKRSCRIKLCSQILNRQHPSISLKISNIMSDKRLLFIS